MAFRLNKRSGTSTESPEALFRDLRNRKVEGLLSQQADMLRKYMEHVAKPDVALQMPTGSGKTLVGLLIAEWRRRTQQERVVYLCPTKQLVNQVVEQACEKYGINALAFTGSQRAYNSSAQAEYLNAEALAVTTYNGLFNTNPFFDNAQLILLDDAHAAENYIGDFWSLGIERRNEEHKSLFEALLSLLKDDIPKIDYMRVTGTSEEGGDRQWINKLPAPLFYAKHDQLFAIFATHCVSGTNLSFKWRALCDHLKACHLYYGLGRFLIRPLISPAESHAPFTCAKQRVYMSATLGEGGELERLVGKRDLTRIPAPDGWDKQGIGRRLFLFPMRTLNEETCRNLLVSMIQQVGRALILTPSEREAEEFRTLLREKLSIFKLFSATDIEVSKRDFVTTDQAVAVVANRYDGIDLVGNECRLLVASGLPKATNLQEQFLISRLGASILYNDRIRTRIVQATGRCTRSSTDYAAVVVLGEQLNKFFLQHESRQYLHPELQAEIAFGIDESRDRSQNDFIDHIQVLLRHDKEWDGVDEYIVSERDNLSQHPLPCVENFVKAAPHEVAYQYALWNGDYMAAIDEARKVLTEIEGPEALRGYRAFWFYLAGNSAWLAYQSGIQGADSIAREYYRRSSKASKGITWLHELARLGLFNEEPEQVADTAIDSMIEGIEQQLESLGTVHNRDFEKRMKDILDGLQQTDAVLFENAQVSLGCLLGFTAEKSSKDSAPDPWWVLTETEGIVFEDYTDCKVDAVISTEKVRQAVSHPAWLQDLPEYKGIQFEPVIVTPARELGNGARPVARNCFYWEMSDFVDWALSALTTIRAIRTSFKNPGDLVWRAEAKETLIRVELFPAAILAKIRKSNLGDLPESSRR